MEFHSNQEFTTSLRGLIDRWCDERKLGALSRILPSYLAFNGLTDGWSDLLEALKATRAIGFEAFGSEEWELLNDLIRAAGQALTRR